ncbi:dd-gdca protein [Anaeramoeba flamelloides]|uniref:Dd-gdca protein n=1 Tax=Anaeramoeba flamelloides TaxID=1746091 RepID=A0AAV7ZMM4_9EUKA|nr:dd-gdca protein [Anaeramoeba flamelloides]
MKIFLLLIVVCWSFADESVCPNIINYNQVSSSCNVTNNELCYPSTRCYNDLYCLQDNTGRSCQQSEKCWSEICSNEICTIKKASGKYCNINEECYSGKCIDSVCKGIKENQPCNVGGHDRQCEKGLFCASSKGVCIKQIEEEVECGSYLKPGKTDYKIACKPGLICDPSNSSYDEGFCVPLHSRPSGSSCGIADSCEYGLGCINGVCSASDQECDQINENQCALTHYCKCNDEHSSGKCIQLSNSDCQYEASQLVDCLSINECNYGEQFGTGSCIHSFCWLQSREFQCCSQRGFDTSYIPNIGIDCTKRHCGKNKYVGFKEKCDDYELLCQEGLFCKNIDPSSGSEMVCITDNTGDECQNDQDCYWGHCNNEKCDGVRGVGADCDNNEQCSTGICNHSKCWGVEEGTECVPDPNNKVCGKGSFCDNIIEKKCIQQLKSGDDCTNWIDEPNFDYTCESMHVCDVIVENNTKRGICKPIRGVQKGEKCGSQQVCAPPYQCIGNLCIEKSLCNEKDNIYCPSGFNCQCQTNYSGNCVQIANTDCQDEYQQLLQCNQKFECETNEAFVVGSCQYHNCQEENNNFQCCLQKGFSDSYYLSKLITCPKASPTPSPSVSQVKDDVKNQSHKWAIGFGVAIPLCIILIITVYFFFKRHPKNRFKNELDDRLLEKSVSSDEKEQN